MPRYYFDLHEDMDLYRDEDGGEFGSDADARLGAVGRMGKLLGSLPSVTPAGKLFIVAVRRAAEQDPFAAVSVRITALR